MYIIYIYVYMFICGTYIYIYIYICISSFMTDCRIHALMGGIIWWAWGFAFAFGNVDSNGFIGNKYYFGVGVGDD